MANQDSDGITTITRPIPASSGTSWHVNRVLICNFGTVFFPVYIHIYDFKTQCFEIWVSSRQIANVGNKTHNSVTLTKDNGKRAYMSVYLTISNGNEAYNWVKLIICNVCALHWVAASLQMLFSHNRVLNINVSPFSDFELKLLLKWIWSRATRETYHMSLFCYTL